MSVCLSLCACGPTCACVSMCARVLVSVCACVSVCVSLCACVCVLASVCLPLCVCISACVCVSPTPVDRGLQAEQQVGQPGLAGAGARRLHAAVLLLEVGPAGPRQRVAHLVVLRDQLLTGGQGLSALHTHTHNHTHTESLLEALRSEHNEDVSPASLP